MYKCILFCQSLGYVDARFEAFNPLTAEPSRQNPTVIMVSPDGSLITSENEKVELPESLQTEEVVEETIVGGSETEGGVEGQYQNELVLSAPPENHGSELLLLQLNQCGKLIAPCQVTLNPNAG